MSPSISRRSLIRASATFTSALFAGCTDTVTSDEPSHVTSDATGTESSRDATEPTTSAAGNARTISHAWTQQNVIYRATAAHRKVEAVAGKQLVLAVGPKDIARSEPELCLGDNCYPRVSEYGDAYVGNIVVDEQYAGDDQRVFGFAVPDDIDAENGVIEWTVDGKTVTWELPSSVVAAITDPPEFEVTKFDAPDRVRNDETFEVEATIVNRGGTGGHFRAEFGTNARTDHEEITVPVQSEEQVSWSRTIDAGGYDERELTVTLDWGLGSRTETVRTKSESTTR